MDSKNKVKTSKGKISFRDSVESARIVRETCSNHHGYTSKLNVQCDHKRIVSDCPIRMRFFQNSLEESKIGYKEKKII